MKAKLILIVGALLAALLLAACGGDDDDDDSSAADSAPAASGGEWSLAEAAEPFQGTELRILDEVTDLQPAMAELIPEFERATGIDVNYELEGHVDVIRKGEADLISGRGAFDAVMIHSVQKGRVLAADSVQFIDEFLDDESLRDPEVRFEDFQQPVTDELTEFEDQRIGFPNWLYNQVYWVRQGLLENPQEQRAFEQEFGYELGLPKTMEQVRDIAEFFDRDEGEELAGETLDQDIAGFVQEGGRAASAFYGVVYNYMENFGGGIFAEDGQPDADQPQDVEGLELYQELWDFAPPGQAEMTLIDIPVVMGEGRAASGFVFSDFVFSVDQQGESPFAGDFLYAGIPPVEEGSETRSAATEPSTIVINAAGDNPEATYLFLQWMVSPETQRKFLESGVGIPIRPREFRLVEDGPRANLYEAVRSSLEVAQSFPTVPEMFEIFDQINLIQQQVGQGETSPQDGAAELQSQMEEICGGSCVIGGPT